jgi:hypothetical protein
LVFFPRDRPDDDEPSWPDGVEDRPRDAPLGGTEALDDDGRRWCEGW